MHMYILSTVVVSLSSGAQPNTATRGQTMGGRVWHPAISATLGFSHHFPRLFRHHCPPSPSGREEGGCGTMVRPDFIDENLG